MKGLLLLAGLVIAMPIQARKSLPNELDGYSVWYGYSSETSMTLCSLVVEGKFSPEDDQHRLCFERLCEEPSSDSRSWKDQLCDEMDESRLEELERERNNPRLQED